MRKVAVQRDRCGEREGNKETDTKIERGKGRWEGEQEGEKQQGERNREELGVKPDSSPSPETEPYGSPARGWSANRAIQVTGEGLESSWGEQPEASGCFGFLV